MDRYDRRAGAAWRRDGVGSSRLLPLLWLVLLLACVHFLHDHPRPSSAQVPHMMEKLESRIQVLRGLIQAGNYSEATAQSRILLAEVESQYGPRSMHAAMVLDVLVKSLYSGAEKDNKELTQLALRAVAIKEHLLENDDVTLAESWANLGTVYRQMERYSEARKAFDRALRLRQEAYGTKHMDIAASYQDLATLLTELGLYAEAKEHQEKALEITEELVGAHDPALVQMLYNHGRVLVRLAEYEEAERQYERALAILREGEQQIGEAYILNGLANLHDVTGRHTAARDRYREALHIAEVRLGDAHPLVIACLNNLGSVSVKLGDYNAARDFFSRALGRARQSHGESHSETVGIEARLADLDHIEGREAEARVGYERVLPRLERILGPGHTDVGYWLAESAKPLMALGQYAEAVDKLRRSLRILEATYDSKNEHLIVPLLALAELERTRGNLAGACAQSEAAVAIAESALSPSHPLNAEVLSQFGLVLAQQGKWSEAVTLALRAETVAREHVRLTIQALPEREAINHWSRVTGGMDLAMTVLASSRDSKLTEPIWESLIHSRALVLDEQASRQAVTRATQDRETRRLALEYQQATRRLSNLVFESLVGHSHDSPRVAIINAREAQERAAAALAKRSATFGRNRLAHASGLEKLRHQLPAGGALVAFVQYNHLRIGREQHARMSSTRNLQPRMFAFVLRRGSPIVVSVPLGATAEIDTLVERWRAEVVRPTTHPKENARVAENRYRQAGKALRDAVWRAIEPHLTGVNRVFVVPDGSLNLVSFAALPTGDSSYAVESDTQYHYLSAERDLGPGKRARIKRASAFFLGGPDFDAVDVELAPAASKVTSRSGPAHDTNVRTWPCSQSVPSHFPRLPGAENEARDLAALWSSRESGKVVLARGSQATEALAKKTMPQFQVCHLATHGIFLGNCSSSDESGNRVVQGLALAPSSEVTQLRRENPLLFSGLAFAGANRPSAPNGNDEDGILTAEEIASLDLGNVDWAVLSACGTGLGDVRSGEGVFGLRRAFQIAGARSVIMSLWSVNDEATREWMMKLYALRLGGQDTASAVTNASRAILEERREMGSAHPFYWAAFVAVGDWR